MCAFHVWHYSPSAWQQLHASKQQTALQDVIGKEFVVELSSKTNNCSSSSNSDSVSDRDTVKANTTSSNSSTNGASSSNDVTLVYTVTAAAAPSPCSDLVQLLHTLGSV
jgi:hypothetical protein